MTDGVLLMMTWQEASALAAVLERVGGQPEGPRGLIDAVYRAIPKPAREATGAYSLTGSVRFESATVEDVEVGG